VTSPLAPLLDRRGEVQERGIPGVYMEREKKKYSGITQNATVSAEKLNLARQMRKRPTTAEAEAWELLRDRRCLGLKFRRQQVIRGFIVDFYCVEKRLAVELDGDVHDLQPDYDQQRDAVLRIEDITVLRIRNEQLTPEYLAQQIRSHVSSPPSSNS
jgi:very-short-patch-repair endonuclease